MTQIKVIHVLGSGHEIKVNHTSVKYKYRLECLRGEIRGGLISWEELAMLQSLAKHIDDDDELLQWADVEEGSR